MTRPRVKDKTIHPSLHLTDTVNFYYYSGVQYTVYWPGLYGRISSTCSAIHHRPPFNIFHGPSSESVHEMDGPFCPLTTSVRLWDRRRRIALSMSLPRFCPDFPEYINVSILSAVRIPCGFEKKAVHCLPVRPDKDETELSELSLFLSADVWD